MKKLFSILTAAAVMASMAAVPASAAEYGTLTMDTQSYIMAPGDIYDFRAKVEGGDLRQEEVVVSDSRTGSVVQLSRVPGTDKYRINHQRRLRHVGADHAGGADDREFVLRKEFHRKVFYRLVCQFWVQALQWLPLFGKLIRGALQSKAEFIFPLPVLRCFRLPILRIG